MEFLLNDDKNILPTAGLTIIYDMSLYSVLLMT